MKKNIVWLASYPKSGNTWLRVFLGNYLANAKQPLDINQIHQLAMGDAMGQLYHLVAGGPLDLYDVDRTVALRPKVLQRISANGADVNLVKTHNRKAEARGITLIPDGLTRSAIYIMRNPLDVVLSYSRHFQMSIEDAATALCHPDNAVGADGVTAAQFLGSWGDHVRSWTAPAPYPVLVLRYEDMLRDPHAEFRKVIEHFGSAVDEERLARAVKWAQFKELKKQEKKKGFVERAKNTGAFFDKGASGQWKRELAPELVRKIRQANKRMMKEHGYWND